MEVISLTELLLAAEEKQYFHLRWVDRRENNSKLGNMERCFFKAKVYSKAASID